MHFDCLPAFEGNMHAAKQKPIFPSQLNYSVEIQLSDYVTLGTFSGIITFKNWWGLLMILRFYLLLRVVTNRYYSGGAKILGMWNNFSFTNQFALRNLMFTHNLLSMIPIAVGMYVGSSYFLFMCERETPSSSGFNIGTAFWIIAITITGVGYGDVVPTTTCGRVVVGKCV